MSKMSKFSVADSSTDLAWNGTVSTVGSAINTIGAGYYGPSVQYTVYGGSTSYTIPPMKKSVSNVERLNLLERMISAGIESSRINQIYNLVKSDDEVSQELGLKVAEEMIKENLNIEKYASKQEQEETLPEEKGSETEVDG